MNKHIYIDQSAEYDLNKIIAEADQLRAEYLTETLSYIAKKLTSFLSAELPKFIPGPLAHR
ncbi:RSP_7527 family protein [Amphritea sp.]|uniref:RSP_7527 family protein n=1 Tax=Amphritea sp. TaxID=1872502 RepID=UPI003D0E5A9D